MSVESVGLILISALYWNPRELKRFLDISSIRGININQCCILVSKGIQTILWYQQNPLEERIEMITLISATSEGMKLRSRDGMILKRDEWKTFPDNIIRKPWEWSRYLRSPQGVSPLTILPDGGRVILRLIERVECVLWLGLLGGACHCHPSCGVQQPEESKVGPSQRISGISHYCWKANCLLWSHSGPI
jgi:hypothetical protein